MKYPASIITAVVMFFVTACAPSAIEKEFDKIHEREAAAELNDLPVISRQYRELARTHPHIRERAMRQADQVDARYVTLLQRNEQIYKDNLRKYGE